MYPGSLIGPFDHTLQLGRVLFDLKKGKMRISPGGGSSFCHVTEVAKAHVQAAKRGLSG
jgi:dihydroflavonol-4-reductase